MKDRGPSGIPARNAQSVEMRSLDQRFGPRLWLSFQILIFIALCSCHGWLTLGLFGDDHSWKPILNDRLIFSGSHALHYYHGVIGAHGWSERGRLSSFDPSFNGGYLKTPWFDAGSRPAELFQFIAKTVLHEGDHPAAYKAGFALCLLLLPASVVIAVRLIGGSFGLGCLATLAAMGLFWSGVGRPLISAGNFAVIPGTMLTVLTLALFTRYHTAPGFCSWSALVGVWSGLCFCEALIWLVLVPAVLIFWTKTAGEHGAFWQLGMLGAIAMTGLINWFWLRDLFEYWWLRTDKLTANLTGNTGSDFLTLFWSHPVWQDEWSRLVTLAVLGAGVFGLVVMFLQRSGTSALTMGGFIACSLGGAFFGNAEELIRLLETDKLLFVGQFVSIIPAIFGLSAVLAVFSKLWGYSLWSGILGSTLLAAMGFFLQQPLTLLMKESWEPLALSVGLPPEIQRTVDAIQERTTPAGRILWEETELHDFWSPLLPRMTQREYIGGLGPKAQIEHAAIRLRDGILVGRPIEEWQDNQLSEYCRIYNIGWVICRSDSVRRRLANWPAATKSEELPNGDSLFTINRTLSYFLVGKGTVIRADIDGITLTDLEPVEGKIVLSFHYHSGLRGSMDRIRVEKHPHRFSAIPLIRLQAPIAVARLTLHWDP